MLEKFGQNSGEYVVCSFVSLSSCDVRSFVMSGPSAVWPSASRHWAEAMTEVQRMHGSVWQYSGCTTTWYSAAFSQTASRAAVAVIDAVHWVPMSERRLTLYSQVYAVLCCRSSIFIKKTLFVVSGLADENSQSKSVQCGTVLARSCWY